MKTVAEIQRTLKSEQPYLAERYGVRVVGIFGSYVRGEQGPESDIDILIELAPPPRTDLFDLVNLGNYLSDRLGVKVDLAIKGNLRKRIGKRILSEVVSI
jgi:predicted nucleotidyltransferase